MDEYYLAQPPPHITGVAVNMRQLIKRITCCLALATGVASWAEPARSESTNQPNSLALHIHTLSFLQNNEYFGPFIEGYTLGGYQVHPYLAYQSPPGITAKWGIFLQRDWADTKLFSNLTPTFTLQYKKDHTTFLMGTLDGIHTHQLLQPLCNTQRAMMEKPETGLRIYHAHGRTLVDLWLHWLTLLNKSVQMPEELMAGLSFEQSLVDTDLLTLQIPLQVILYHLGGQGVPVRDYSLWVGALGSRLSLRKKGNGLLKKLCLETYYITSHYAKQPDRPFLRGHGLYSQITCHTAWVDLQASYWNAYGFSSENLGHPLYQSMKLVHQHVVHQEAHRHLVFFHINYTHDLTKDLKLVLHMDPYYDINHHLLEHAAGLYITYRPCFELNR